MNLRIEGLDDVLKQLEGIDGKVDKAIKAGLEEGGLVLARNTKSAVTAAAHRGYSTGALAGSIHAAAPKKNARGSFVVVRPGGTDSKGVRNGAKWGFLQYKHGEHFKDAAIAASQGQCEAIMRKHIESLAND